VRVVIRHPSPALAQALEAQLHAQDAQLRIVQVDPGAPHSPAALTLATAAPPPTSADCGVWVTLDPDGPLPDPAALTAAVTAARARARSLGGLLPTHRLLGALRQIVDLAPESIEITDQSVRLLYGNAAFEAITGWPIEDAAGHSTGELFRAGTHEPSYYAGIMEVLRRGEAWRGPLIGRRRDGELSLQEATLAPVLGEDGAPEGFIAIKRDIGRDALASAAMESRERRFESLVNGAGDGVYVHDVEGRVLDANPVGCAMLGVRPEARPPGLSLADHFEPASGEDLATLLSGVELGAPLSIEGQLRGPSGPAPVSLRVGAFLFGGERFLLTIARDVRERVALEERLRERGEALARALDEQRALQAEIVRREKMAALGELVAGVAHEVNTPLGVTVTAVSHAQTSVERLRAALQSPTPSRRAVQAAVEALDEALGLASVNAARAAALVADFKRVSVDQSSDLEREIELAAYAATVCSSLSPLLREGQAEVVLEVGAGRLLTRPGALAQILSNLIQNAVMHAFPEGSLDRRIWVRGGLTPTEAWLEVEDRGCGIDPALRDRVLLPFVSTRLGSGGSGLGLTVVHNLVVELLGGRLSLDGAPGVGTTVQVRFPLRGAARPA
jgi:PAS domain S-box-containing protein